MSEITQTRRKLLQQLSKERVKHSDCVIETVDGKQVDKRCGLCKLSDEIFLHGVEEPDVEESRPI